MAPNIARRVYSAEQLHRFRSASSQPRLHEAIEEHDVEDAELIKEHVLRGSRSFAARSWKSRASVPSLRVPSNNENRSTNVSDNGRPAALYIPRAVPILGEIVGNNQILRPPFLGYKPGPSPTPSLRKKKIESLVKAHGSPDHVRVTAGGRIVPSEQSPLCHPRYGYSAIKTNGGLIKFAPNLSSGKATWTQATQNGFVAQDVNGRLCQIVDGTILPLHETEAGLQLYIPAPNLNITQPVPAMVAPHMPSNRLVSAGTAVHAEGLQEPPVMSQIHALELEYSKLEHELKDVDKTEVLHGRAMGKGARDALIAKRRELIVNLDKIRKALKSLREQPMSTSPPQAFGGKSISPPRNRLPAFLQQRQNQPTAMPGLQNGLPIYAPGFGGAPTAPGFGGPYNFHTTPSPDSGFGGQSWPMPPPTMFMPPPPFDGSMSSTSLPYPAVPLDMAPAVLQQPIANQLITGHLPQNDGARSFADLQKVSSPMHSRALPIKAPHSAVKSSLNPMSPIYKPDTGMLPAQDTRTLAKPTIKPVDSPTKTMHKIHSSSVSSLATADFFPTNTTEYSTRKYTNDTTDHTEDKENVDPVTPAKATSGLTHVHSTPVAPPATPIDGVPDRSQNVSPKTRIFTELRSRASSSQSDEWLAGYQAGLQQVATMTGFQFPQQRTGSDQRLAAASETPLDQHNANEKLPRAQHPPSRCLSATTTSIGSRPGRIFSGLFAQVDSSTATESVHAPSPSGNNNHEKSPEKSSKASPARQKFEKIAESVGIKVDNLSPTKKRWRDVWRSSKN
ncbi:hypothetical protein LTR78_001938 [Recurvomyces mirabilis]|uniref:Uncharacterized protein n=1 Tax=Recurvomyces mirabilis TaxID=574656 RepID=A0AAE0WTN7_9PEZI|nr:hypothetical protein LTR78_001938 [Recurvomyces mirabilis]KAK5160396.1 hypothetical protein LTS14_001408 [Recurvomyces mirabilis]